jgi:branched-chain amino acid transport system ATP-binding protein
VIEPLLSLEGVHTHIGQYHVLQGVEFVVPKGQLTLLLGRNGAGKTTTLRTIMGLWKASRGRITLQGEDITSLPTPEIARRGVAYVPENMGIFPDLTVAENMLVASRKATRTGDLDPERLERIFGYFPPIRKLWQHRAGFLSGGQKQMLAIARAIVEPQMLLLIDEPSKGLAPAIVESVVRALQDLKSMNTTILLVEQNFSFARKLGDAVAVIDDGRIVYSGTMASLSDDEDLQQRLLGLSLSAPATLNENVQPSQ